jgi:TRAP transporter TAXI family solute receptor
MRKRIFKRDVVWSFDRRSLLKFLAVASLALALALGLNLSPNAGTSFAAKVKDYTFGSASAAGAWYVCASAMGKVISENVPGYRVTGVTTPGASRENVMRIHGREMELGFSTPDILLAAYEGKAPFKEKKDVSGWFCPYPSYVILVARKGTGATKVSDLKGMRIATGTPGSATQMFNDEVFFPAHGLMPGKDYKAENIRLPEAVQKIIDGHIDAAIYMVPKGNPGYTQMSMSAKLNFIPVEEKAKKEIIKKRPAFFFGNLEPGDYRGIEKPVEMVKFAYQTFCGSYLSEDFMYRATKAVFGNLDFLKKASASMKPLTLENALEGMPIPLHPGAMKFFKEKGVKVR